MYGAPFDRQHLTPVLGQGPIETSHHRWGFCGEAAGPSWGEGRASALTFDPTYVHLKVEPPPRS